MKYIFIDTNQYRHLFSKNEGFSDQIKELIDNLIKNDRVKLLLPQQVRDEVERNRFEDWYKQESDSSKNKIENFRKQIEKREMDLSSFPRELISVKNALNNQITLEEKELKNIKKRYRNLRSKANQKLKSLFEKAEYIQESEEIISQASLRYEKGNPPRDNKFSDALIWESLIQYLSLKAETGSSLVFVARDGDAWGFDGFNPWLAQELKKKTKVTISLAGKLSDIKDLTADEQEVIRGAERIELKANALLNFENSRSFTSAGKNITDLREYKDILTNEDYQRIIDASISNHQIYQSFFTSGGLNYLCQSDNDGYVLSGLESIEDLKWKRFVGLNQIVLKRQKDEKNDDLDHFEIPF